MTATTAFTASRVGDRLRGRVEGPWEVFGEKLSRYEIHLAGPRIELERGPIDLEGFGLRLFRPQGEAIGVGFASSTDLSDAGIDHQVASAEETARFARFPARRAELPSTQVAGPAPSVATTDPALWERPAERVRAYIDALLAAFEGRHGIDLSFGSVRATLTDATLTNSEGIQRHYRHTDVDVEVAVKSSDGPEGPPPGEYWVNRRTRVLSTDGVRDEVDRWAERARDVRRAKPTPTGMTAVVLPPSVLADVLPSILGYRLSGTAQLRKMTPEAGTTIGSPLVTITDDGLLDYGLGSAPYDDEGTPQARRTLIDRGVVSTPMYDVLHASAFGQTSTGNGRRDSPVFQPWFHFDRAPTSFATNLVVRPGTGGSEAELLETVGDGVYVDQLGYAFPDPISGAFGGELRIGYRIRGGKLAEPLRGGTIGGVVLGPVGEPSLLAGVRGLSARNERAGYLDAPAIWTDGLSVAGAD